MPKPNGDKGRRPDRPSKYTAPWALVNILARKKLYQRLFRLLCLVIIALAVVAVIVFLTRGREVPAQGLAAVIASGRLVKRLRR